MAVVRFNLQLGNRLPFHDAVIYYRGGVVNGTQTLTNTVTIHAGHDFVDGHKFYYALALNNVRKDRVFTITSHTSTTVTYSGAAFTWVNGSFLVPLGADTGATQQTDGSWSDPKYDGSTVAVYSDPHADSAYLYSVVGIIPGGDLGFWCSTSDLWILARDSRQNIKAVYIVSQSSTSGGGGGGSVVVAADTTTPGDNNNPSFLVVRSNGVGDILYIWVKDSSDAYHWEQILQIA